MEKMQEVYSYLFRTEPYRLFTFGAFKVSAYLLVRPEGNLLIYSSNKIEKYFPFIENKGGLQATFITHVHEASPYCNTLADQYGIPFYSPEAEYEDISKSCNVDKTYTGDFHYDKTFEVISTPGHTPGSSCFLWTAPDDKRILFSGDNLYPTSNERWDGFALSKNNIPEIIKSLKKIQKLDVDVIVPAGHSVKNLFYKEVDKEEWKDLCSGAISRFEKKL